MSEGEGQGEGGRAQQFRRVGSRNLSQFYPAKLLVVEDNAINLKVIKYILANLGFDPDTASNGREAIEACEEKIYDIIFMDVQMPEMDGITASRHILQKPSKQHRPIIIPITATAFPEDKQKCKEVGMQDFIQKPISEECIAGILEKHLGSLAQKNSQAEAPQHSKVLGKAFENRDTQKNRPKTHPKA